jgi:hypothetical protein
MCGSRDKFPKNIMFRGTSCQNHDPRGAEVCQPWQGPSTLQVHASGSCFGIQGILRSGPLHHSIERTCSVLSSLTERLRAATEAARQCYRSATPPCAPWQVRASGSCATARLRLLVLLGTALVWGEVLGEEGGLVVAVILDDLVRHQLVRNQQKCKRNRQQR